ncbi:MAG: DUF2892 domain-containing protein [Candidatus Nanopelagicales bacterium]
MAANVGGVDRLVRLALAAVLIGLAAPAGAWPLAVLAVLIAVTAATRRCPLYALYRVSTVGGPRRTDCEDGSCGLPGTRR